MTKIVLDAQQAKIVRETNEPIEFLDPDGHTIGYIKLSYFSPQEVAEAEARANSGGPWYTTKELLEHLEAIGPS